MEKQAEDTAALRTELHRGTIKNSLFTAGIETHMIVVKISLTRVESLAFLYCYIESVRSSVAIRTFKFI